MSKKQVTFYIIIALVTSWFLVSAFNEAHATEQLLFQMGDCSKKSKDGPVLCYGRLTNSTTKNIVIAQLTVTLYMKGDVVDQEYPMFANIATGGTATSLIFFDLGRPFDKYEWAVSSLQQAQ